MGGTNSSTLFSGSPHLFLLHPSYIFHQLESQEVGNVHVCVWYSGRVIALIVHWQCLGASGIKLSRVPAPLKALDVTCSVADSGHLMMYVVYTWLVSLCVCCQWCMYECCREVLFPYKRAELGSSVKASAYVWHVSCVWHVICMCKN